MQLMNKNLWVIVSGKEKTPTNANKLLHWSSRDDKAKAIIGHALFDTELQHIDLDKSLAKIWDNLNKLFVSKAINIKFSLKLPLFRFKMEDGITMSNHISNLQSLIRQLAEVKVMVDDDDARAILLNSLPSKNTTMLFLHSVKYLDKLQKV